MMRAAAVLVATAMLAGCAEARHEPPGMTPPAPPGRCDAGKVQRLIGTVPTAALVEAARRRSNAAVVRTILPGTMVTMDYRPDRLNLILDKAGKLVTARCG